MKKNLGVIIGKRDATEGTIYYTEICDYLVLEEDGKIVVEGKVDDPKKLEELDFIPEDEKGFVVGYFDSEEEKLQYELLIKNRNKEKNARKRRLNRYRKKKASLEKEV